VVRRALDGPFRADQALGVLRTRKSAIDFVTTALASPFVDDLDRQQPLLGVVQPSEDARVGATTLTGRAPGGRGR
jgi:hypothetical protein